MRIFIVFIMASMFLGCASAKKQTDAAQTQTTPPAPVVQETTKNTAKSDVDVVKKEVCESDKDTRSLVVHKKKPGCELSYEKFGKSQVVSSGKYGTKHCEDSLEKIAKKLEAQSLVVTKKQIFDLTGKWD